MRLTLSTTYSWSTQFNNISVFSLFSLAIRRIDENKAYIVANENAIAENHDAIALNQNATTENHATIAENQNAIAGNHETIAENVNAIAGYSTDMFIINLTLLLKI